MIRVPIIEVGLRSIQGATQPFRCQAEDGTWYWVKGTKAGPESLCAEWIAGRLGRLLGLPIPEVAQVEIPDQLISESAIPGIGDVGSGIRFGSRDVAGAQEYDLIHVPLTDQTLRWRVLLFDAWIRNTDRSFSRPFGSSGNPNLLWEVPDRRLVVIDHNNAFLDDDLLAASRFGGHVFAGERSLMPEPFLQATCQSMEQALAQLPEIWAELPPAWQFLDENQKVPCRLTAERVVSILDLVRQGPQALLEVLR